MHCTMSNRRPVRYDTIPYDAPFSCRAGRSPLTSASALQCIDVVDLLSPLLSSPLTAVWLYAVSVGDRSVVVLVPFCFTLPLHDS